MAQPDEEGGKDSKDGGAAGGLGVWVGQWIRRWGPRHRGVSQTCRYLQVGRKQMQRPELHERQIAVAKRAPELSGRARVTGEGGTRAATV